MDLFHQLGHAGCHELVLERDPVPEGLAGYPERRVVPALVDEVLGLQWVAEAFLKSFHCRYRDGGGVAEPVDEALGSIGAVDEGEVVEEGREAYYVDLGVIGQPLVQGVAYVLPGLGIADVVGRFFDPLWIVGPTVGEIVIHLGGVPALHSQETDGVDVSGLGLVHRHAQVGWVNMPCAGGDDIPGGAIDHLPPPLDIAVGVGIHLVNEPIRHQVDR